MQLPKLNFSLNFDFKITKSSANEYLIYDPIRRRDYILTPEEWVRQHFIHYLIQQKITRSRILVEKSIAINGTQKRFDILTRNRYSYQVLVECKAPEIALGMNHFDQLARYNSVINAPIILLSNGIQHRAFEQKDENEYKTIESEDLLGRVFSQ